MITIFISNFFGSAGNKFLAEFRGRENFNNFIFTLKIIFFGSVASLVFCKLYFVKMVELFLERFSLPQEAFSIIIIYIFFRTMYILFRRTLYGMDLVKNYTFNEIVSALFMLGSTFYVCFIGNENFLLQTYILSYIIFFLFVYLVFQKASDYSKKIE